MHIQVYDGWTFNASQRLLRLSGKNTIHTPFSVKSSVPRMLVRFITDDSINNFLGFFATYTQTNSAIDCNRIINGTNDGFISSPNFPSNYGINNLDCRSFITVPNGFRDQSPVFAKPVNHSTFVSRSYVYIVNIILKAIFIFGRQI